MQIFDYDTGEVEEQKMLTPRKNANLFYVLVWEG